MKSEDTAERVAVLVVHGVADQQPGESLDAFVNLMVAGTPGIDARYVAVSHEDFSVKVAPISPTVPFEFGAELTPTRMHRLRRGATPDSGDRGFRKSLLQSIKSDFHRKKNLASASLDRGLAYTNYLLHKAVRNGTPPDRFSSRMTRMQRQGSEGRATDIDAFEMYWADQSRLAGAIPRIVTELFTLFFRLSRLGRNTVEEAVQDASKTSPKGHVGWSALNFLQTAIDWSFTNVLAQLFAQLLLIGAFLFAVGQAGPLEKGPPLAPYAAEADACQITENSRHFCNHERWPTQEVQAGDQHWVGLVLLLLALLVSGYFATQRSKVPRSALAAIAGLEVAGLLIAVIPIWIPGLVSTWGFGFALLALLTAVYLAVLKASDVRFPFIWYTGSAIWTVVVVVSVLRLSLVHAGGGNVRDQLLWGGLTALELVLLGIKYWWIVMAVIIVPWGLLSVWLSVIAWRADDYRRRGSAATGRLGALLSLGTFLIVAMALWAGVGTAVKLPVAGHMYEPLAWVKESPSTSSGRTERGSAETVSTKAAQLDAADLPWYLKCDPSDDRPSRDAAQFVDCRFVGSTQTFSAIVLLLIVVLVYLVMLTAPSVVAELLWVHSDRRAEARRLGIWLTWFFRHLDHVVLLMTIVGVGIVVLVASIFAVNGLNLPDALAHLVGSSGDTSQALLHRLVIPAASAFAALSAFGGMLSRGIPGLRAPLDAALDVDNYMREFPRRAIPRARIFARFAALLEVVRQGGYDRVVIVAHSQGTVISSELLRYLSSESLRRGQEGRSVRLKALLNCDAVRMLTVGCPLRQLYAARFPTLYDWVLNNQDRRNGPRAEDVGVDVWVNAFGSGDYVGRWLWSKTVELPRRYHPLLDGIGTLEPPGRSSAYDLFAPMPPGSASLKELREYETCIGFAAHTHYFDLPRTATEHSIAALLADELIARK